MKYPIVFAKLTPLQIELAKEANGKNKKITHAVLCGKYGQIFGTEKYCLKYFNVWKADMKKLFSKSLNSENAEIINYETTFNLVNILIRAMG